MFHLNSIVLKKVESQIITYLSTFRYFLFFLFNFLFSLNIFIIRRFLTEYKYRMTAMIFKNLNVKFDLGICNWLRYLLNLFHLFYQLAYNL